MSEDRNPYTSFSWPGRTGPDPECPRRTTDGGMWYCMSCPRCLGGIVFASGANDDAPEIESECSECPGQCEVCAGPKTLSDAVVAGWDLEGFEDLAPACFACGGAGVLAPIRPGVEVYCTPCRKARLGFLFYAQPGVDLFGEEL